jgi:hypothetical protein
MPYQIKELNTSKFNELELSSVLRTAWKSFIPEDSNYDVITEKEVDNFVHSPYPLQHFYLTDTQTGEIVASLGLIIRDSNINSKKNIVLTAVNTTKAYRKKGLMESLICFTISFYEDQNIKKPDFFQIDEETLENSKKFILKYVPIGSFWTLYSAVDNYYSKFGFQSFKTLNFYSTQVSVFNKEELKTDYMLANNEQFLTLDNAEFYLTDDKYIPNQEYLAKDNFRSCSFKQPSIFRFLKGNKFYFKSLGIELSHFGIIIKSNEETTFLCLAHHFNPKTISIRRFFTNVKSEDSLNLHLQRIYIFISCFVNNYSLYDDSILCLAEGDIVSNDENKQTILDFFKLKGWKWDDTNSKLNPMMREWKGENSVNTEWKYNGFWCYT